MTLIIEIMAKGTTTGASAIQRLTNTMWLSIPNSSEPISKTQVAHIYVLAFYFVLLSFLSSCCCCCFSFCSLFKQGDEPFINVLFVSFFFLLFVCQMYSFWVWRPWNCFIHHLPVRSKRLRLFLEIDMTSELSSCIS